MRGDVKYILDIVVAIDSHFRLGDNGGIENQSPEQMLY